MKRILLFLLLLPCLATARQAATASVILTYDSIRKNDGFNISEHWRFHIGDNALMAAPGYNDTSWDMVDSRLGFKIPAKQPSDTFSSIGWFRLHLIADSSVTGIPLALKISQYGASEIFLDGKKVIAYGTINGRDSTIGYDPQSLPFVIVLPNAGEHVIAVRYANYKARRFFERNQASASGFTIAIGDAKNAIERDHTFSIVLPAMFSLLFGFFIAFSMAHLFLFLFYRAERSNLYFSLFCLCLASEFLLMLIHKFSADPSAEVSSSFIMVILLALGCIFFSGFTNYLFSAKKTRLRILSAIFILVPFLLFFNKGIGTILCLTLITFVFVEAAFITIRAMYRRVRGARIIGAGILFFASFFLVTITMVLVSKNNRDVSDATVGGQIYMLLMIVAILCMPVFMSIYLAWNFADVNSSLKKQLQQVEVLSAQTLAQEHEKKLMLEAQKDTLEREVAARTKEVVAQKEEIEQQHSELKTEKKKSDDLLLNILPAEVAEELKEKGSSSARLFDHVTVMFTDFVDFTTAGERLSPQELVNELHTCFKAFDEIISKYGIEKIKTIGDAYLAVCGLPEVTDGHAGKTVLAALEIVEFMQARRQQLGDKTFEVRVGLHTGSVVAGIVGVKKFAYDIWGDTVNTAARLEQHSEPGKINISQTTYDLVKNKFTCTPRGKIQAKNKGELSMYFVEGVMS